MKNKKAFTLIEVLIVVIIIAVLAALIMPRFITQPEKAMIAEAQMQLGALRRAQQNFADMAGGDGSWLPGAPDWTRLGLTQPHANGKFNYTCSSSSCTATRKTNTNQTIQLYDNGTYQCGSGYRAAGNNTASNDRGCTI